MYYKPTDTHQYLHFSSCHPGHTKRAIPYNLARRVCTIVSDNEKRNERLHELKASLIKQCYPVGIIDDGIKKALALNRENLINPSENNTSDLKKLPLVTTHNPNDINIIPVVCQLNNILQTDEKMSEVLKKSSTSSTVKDNPGISEGYFASLLFNVNLILSASVTIPAVELANTLKSGNRSSSGTRTLLLMRTCLVPLKMLYTTLRVADATNSI